MLIYESVIGRVNGVRNLPAMTSLLSRFAYQRQAVFLNLHYAAETWYQSIRMEDCVCPREAKQLEKYERLLNLVSIDTTERLLVTSPRSGMQGMRAKCGKRPHRQEPADLLAANFTCNHLTKTKYKIFFFACQYTLSRAYTTWRRAWSDFIARAVKFAKFVIIRDSSRSCSSFFVSSHVRYDMLLTLGSWILTI